MDTLSPRADKQKRARPASQLGCARRTSIRPRPNLHVSIGDIEPLAEILGRLLAKTTTAK